MSGLKEKKKKEKTSHKQFEIAVDKINCVNNWSLSKESVYKVGHKVLGFLK